MSGKVRPRVLDVGQCDLDHAGIRAMLAEHFDAQVDRAGRADEAMNAVVQGSYDLVLVNRMLDTDGSQGMDLIRRLQAGNLIPATPVMLVSNYPEAQEAAVKLGARRGFGKGALNAPETLERLGSCLRPTAPAQRTVKPD